ncbi:type II CAAX endopeptidase family protein [Psychroserpens sp. AS72]|uniref:type II CAAX endopeptidase family protein n=1 Tax=Psychroserpens sp. AS72 TaxID=3135775 RepID=UPI00316BBC77
MGKRIYFLFILLATLFCSAQDIQVNQEDSYELFVETLVNSKDIRFNAIIESYDAYIEKHPNEIDVQVYKCKFIGSAYYDEYEDYNLKYEETNDCINQLYEDYPEYPAVILYKLENTYSDEKEELLYKAMSNYNSNKKKWTYQQGSELYEMASYFYVEDDDYKTITYGEKAVRLSDSLDLSVLLARAHIRNGNTDEAKERLMNALYYDGNAWQLQQKGELLIEFGEIDEALKMFDRVKVKDSSYTNSESLYKIFVKEKDYEVARSYLVSDTLNDWSKTANIQKLLNHDLLYSDGDLALVSYRRMQELSYYDDFLGIKRIRLFFKAPFNSWTFNEISHILVLFACILVIFLLPYVLVLPIYSANKLFKLKPIALEQRIPVNWTLKHFWLISFVYLISQVLLMIIFYYQDYMNYFFDIVYSYVDEELLESQLLTANSIIAYSIIALVLTLLFLNKKRLKFVLHTNMRYLQVAGLSIVFLIVNAILLKILRGFIDIDEAASFIQTLSMQEEIKALLFEYGFGVSFLIIAVIVPFYEEIMFRGILLSSTEKHLGFKWANVIQASLFAVVHFNFGLFIFYFVFGLITGYAVKRTDGLLTGIVFHAVNNFFVLLALYMVSKYVPGIY